MKPKYEQITCPFCKVEWLYVNPDNSRFFCFQCKVHGQVVAGEMVPEVGDE